jgi:hypothetical protein
VFISRPAISLNEFGLPDLAAPPQLHRGVHAHVVVTAPNRLTSRDRERVLAGVQSVLQSATDAWDAGRKLDAYLRKTGGRRRLPVEVAFTNVER